MCRHGATRALRRLGVAGGHARCGARAVAGEEGFGAAAAAAADFPRGEGRPSDLEGALQGLRMAVDAVAKDAVAKVGARAQPRPRNMRIAARGLLGAGSPQRSEGRHARRLCRPLRRRRGRETVAPTAKAPGDRLHDEGGGNVHALPVMARTCARRGPRVLGHGVHRHTLQRPLRLARATLPVMARPAPAGGLQVSDGGGALESLLAAPLAAIGDFFAGDRAAATTASGGGPAAAAPFAIFNPFGWGQPPAAAGEGGSEEEGSGGAEEEEGGGGVWAAEVGHTGGRWFGGSSGGGGDLDDSENGPAAADGGGGGGQWLLREEPGWEEDGPAGGGAGAGGGGAEEEGGPRLGSRLTVVEGPQSRAKRLLFC